MLQQMLMDIKVRLLEILKLKDETVTGGTWDVKVYVYGFLVQEDTGNVCDLIPNW